MMKMTEVSCLWRAYLAERNLTVVKLKDLGGTEREDQLWREFLVSLLEQEEEKTRRQAETIEQASESPSELPALFVSFKDTPLRIYTYFDSRPTDSWVYPTEKEKETILGAVFTEKQIAILQGMVIRRMDKSLSPTKFSVKTCHQYYEFREPHYVASVEVGCWVEKSYLILRKKHETTREGYTALENPSGWIF